MLGINCERVEVEVLAHEIGCGRETWPIKYAGVPLEGCPIKVSIWEPVLSKMSMKLAS